ALVRVHAEEALLEMRIALVPEGGREAEQLIAVADAGDAVFAPAIGFAARFVVGEVAPGVAVGGVVLADGAPGSIRQIGAPATPAAQVVADFADALLLAVDGVGGGRPACRRHRRGEWHGG